MHSLKEKFYTAKDSSGSSGIRKQKPLDSKSDALLAALHRDFKTVLLSGDQNETNNALMRIRDHATKAVLKLDQKLYGEIQTIDREFTVEALYTLGLMNAMEGESSHQVLLGAAQIASFARENALALELRRVSLAIDTLLISIDNRRWDELEQSATGKDEKLAIVSTLWLVGIGRSDSLEKVLMHDVSKDVAIIAAGSLAGLLHDEVTKYDQMAVFGVANDIVSRSENTNIAAEATKQLTKMIATTAEPETDTKGEKEPPDTIDVLLRLVKNIDKVPRKKEVLNMLSQKITLPVVQSGNSGRMRISIADNHSIREISGKPTQEKLLCALKIIQAGGTVYVKY